MQPILVSYEVPFRSNFQENTGPVVRAGYDIKIVCIQFKIIQNEYGIEQARIQDFS